MEKLFYDRYEELQLLKEKFNRLEQGEFGVIYGRRRVGKSELLRRFSEKISCKKIFLTVTFQSKAELKRALSKKIEEVFGDVVRIEQWSDYFDYLLEKIKNEKFLLVFDEFQRLDKFARDFIYGLQEYWDKYLKRTKIMLIICGSSMSMMHKIALEEKGPLYGRKTFRLHLKQFTYIDFRQMFSDIKEEDKVKIFAVYGGTPKYLSDFKDGKKDIFESIKELVISDRGTLYNEPLEALKLELKNPERYISILRSISKGKKELKEIADDLQLGSPQLTPYLSNLIELLDIVHSADPLFGKKKMKRYEIKDNFFRFWYRFIYPNMEQIQFRIIEPTLQRIYKEFDDYCGRIFEDVVKEFMYYIRDKKIKRLDIHFFECGKWWERGEDIDLVLKDKATSTFIEIKFRNDKIGSRVYEELKNKSLKTSARGKFRYILVSKGGFEQELIDRKIPNLILLTLEDIQGILDEETKKDKEEQSALKDYFNINT